ncbi:MAG: TetR/AcrR family transcriptional regulator [Aurantimonas endophytica]|uniref:AcrR family transcriptional regulator n=1 Tax=Aurantimonas endophytica TaxID=1522175 RepID=A0A7W6MR96_9HYPH|nr:TetR/AcrR family transcriptional regulator [Aurantimonas endophytica]MBB4004805.1 AcrR family transcriptional regulator [Aurantimonas endophytica]MCO6405615.1 TetR family transcriptional regulator [Aurantimonas endophytica]
MDQSTLPGQTTIAKARRRLSPDERRRMIVEGAVTFFSEVGLEGTTRDLSRHLGVTQPLLYRYFGSKESLLEAVFQSVYIDRLDPAWHDALLDRSTPFETRLRNFYRDYTRAIFTYEWMRIFMFSGLAGADLNRRYLSEVETVYLKPLLEEARHEFSAAAPQMEDVWGLHGGIIYLAIRKFIYRLPMPDDLGPLVDRMAKRFADSYRNHSTPLSERP